MASARPLLNDFFQPLNQNKNCFMFRRIKKIYDSLQFYKQTNIPNTSKEYNGRALVLFMKQSEKRYGQRSRRHFRTRTGQCWSQVCGELFSCAKNCSMIKWEIFWCNEMGTSLFVYSKKNASAISLHQSMIKTKKVMTLLLQLKRKIG